MYSKYKEYKEGNLDPQEQQRPIAPELKQDIAAVAPAGYTIDSFGTIIFVVVVVQIVILVGLNLYQKSRAASLQKTLASKQAQLQTPTYKTANDQVNQVLSGNAQLAAALAGKVHWDKFYTELDAVTPKNVQLTTLSIAANGSFKADGRTGSLDNLAKALVAWQQGVGTTVTPFASVTLASDGFGASGSNRQVTFSINGQVNLGALK